MTWGKPLKLAKEEQWNELQKYIYNLAPDLLGIGKTGTESGAGELQKKWRDLILIGGLCKTRGFGQDQSLSEFETRAY